MPRHPRHSAFIQRSLAAACLVVAATNAGAADAAASAAAADPAAATAMIAIVSVIGDHFTVNVPDIETGSHIDQNRKEEIAVDLRAVDGVAMFAAKEAILNLRPVARTLMASIRDPRMFTLEDDLLQPSASSNDMREIVQNGLVKSGAKLMLLITKHNAKASFELEQGVTGHGRLSGVGFYVDRNTEILSAVDKQVSYGYMAVYAYVTASLVDLGSMRVLRTKSVDESRMYLASDKKDAVIPWDALSAQEKKVALDGAIQRAVDSATRAVLAPE